LVGDEGAGSLIKDSVELLVQNHLRKSETWRQGDQHEIGADEFLQEGVVRQRTWLQQLRQGA
jgi:hypothetical protein